MNSPQRVANARMYSTGPAVREDWRRLLGWVLERAGLDWTVLDHDAPAPLAGLWARPDLGLVLMCGLPYALHQRRPLLVAAPIPSPSRYRGRPMYCTDIVVRAGSNCGSLEETFGQTLGYTLTDSMSGGVALAHHLDRFRPSHGQRLYRKSVGGFVNARGVIDALVSGTIDVGPLDSYYHDLLKHSEPTYAAQVRVVASTRGTPIPPFIATAALTADELRRLRATLATVAEAPELTALRESLLLAGFAVPDPADYDVLARIAHSPLPLLDDI